MLDPYISNRLSPGINIEDLSEIFQFRGEDAYCTRDKRLWKADSSYKSEPLKVAGEIFKYLSALAQSQKDRDLVEALLDVFRDNARVAFLWKELLKTASEQPGFFAPLLFELCIARPIQVGNETTYELGLFLEKAAGEFTREQLAQIEESLLEIPNGETDEEKRTFLINTRNRLLGCIPSPMLKTPEARKIIEELKKDDNLPKNEPMIKIISYSTKDDEITELEKKCVDVEKEENKEFIECRKALDNFHKQWSDDSPGGDALKREMLKKAKRAYALVQGDGGAAKELVEELWDKLTPIANTISRGPISPDSEEFRFSREVLLKASEHERPVYENLSDKEFDHPWWSPAPRIDAAEGLCRLAALEEDRDVLSAIEKLAGDNVPAVRFNIAGGLGRLYPQNKDFLWNLFADFAHREKNNNILNALALTLGDMVKHEESKTVELLAIITRNFLANRKPPYDKFQGIIVNLVVQFYLKKNPWAIETTDRIFENPGDYLFIFKSFLFEISKYINVGMVKDSDGIFDRALASIEKMMDSVIQAIQTYRLIPGSQLDEGQKSRLEDLYEVYNDVVSDLYYNTDFSLNEQDKKNNLSDKELEEYYFKIKPLLEKLLFYPAGEDKVFIHPATAHNFTQLLNNVLEFDPQDVLHMAAQVALASKPYGYNRVYLAIKEVVKTVETILADHRDKVRDPASPSLEDLQKLLDIFTEVGWPEAIQLTWRLDEIFR
jgi:hypothetical protein